MIEMGMQYSVIVFLFAPTIMIELVFEKLFQATGNMKVTMLSLMCGSIANIILDPLMIFGIGPFPEDGDPRGGTGNRTWSAPDLGNLYCCVSQPEADGAFPMEILSSG